MCKTQTEIFKLLQLEENEFLRRLEKLNIDALTKNLLLLQKTDKPGKNIKIGGETPPR